MVNYSVILGNLGNTCDRFLSTGYKENLPTAQMLKQAAAIEEVKGIEFVGTWDIDVSNYREVKKILLDNNLKCVSIIPDLFSQKRWGRGTLSAKDAAVREEAMAYLREMAGVALELDCPMLNIWPGQDGYDYSLQADFVKERGYLVESVALLAEEFSELRFALEYKPKEPRNHSYFARAADTLVVALDTGRDNVGVTIDVGHALYAGENVAESAALLAQKDKLFHMHFNDNYRYWDDDMIVGSVHHVEYIELLYWLDRMGYSGWYSMDQYPYREEAKGALESSIKFLEGIQGWLTAEGKAELSEIIVEGDAVKMTRWVQKKMFG